jgi:hypothetical protein
LLREFISKIDDIVRFVPLSQKVNGLTSPTYLYITFNFFNQKTKFNSSIIRTKIITTFVHEFIHYLPRLLDIDIDSPLIIDDKKQNGEIGEGGCFFEINIFGSLLEFVSNEQMDFILNSKNWDLSIVEFNKRYVILRKPILGEGSLFRSTSLGGCAFKFFLNK